VFAGKCIVIGESKMRRQDKPLVIWWDSPWTAFGEMINYDGGYISSSIRC
jgi:hypothetical protein